MATQECEHILLKCEGGHSVMCVKCFSLIDAPEPDSYWAVDCLWRCDDCLNDELAEAKREAGVDV